MDKVPKRGRPKTPNPRNINLNLRLTKQEIDDIQECANKLSTTRTNAILQGIGLLKESIQKGK